MQASHVQTALASTSTKLRFQHEANLYRYWYEPAHDLHHSVVKLQVRAKALATFRVSAAGQQVGRHVDILSVGGGWYEVTSRDLPDWDPKWGQQRDGTLLWIKQWNLFHVAAIHANPVPQHFNLKRVRRIEPEPVLGGERNANKRPVWRPSPEQMRDAERLHSKVQQLAAKFSHN